MQFQVAISLPKLIICKTLVGEEPHMCNADRARTHELEQHYSILIGEVVVSIGVVVSLADSHQPIS